jgi:hypothetical protein
MESRRIREAKGELDPMNGPTRSVRCEFEPNTWDALHLSERPRAVVDDPDLDETAIEVFDDDSCVFDESFLNRHVSKQTTHTASFQSQVMGRDAVVLEKSQEVE